jgi:hypothetical protein
MTMIQKLKTRLCRWIICVVSVTFTAVGFATPHWDAQHPGYPLGVITGNTIVATNGTVYALQVTSDGGPVESFDLIKWSYSLGEWVTLAGFTNTEDNATPGALCLGSSNLYIGGVFEGVNPYPLGPAISATNIVALNLNTGEFFPVGNAAKFQYYGIDAITVDANQRVYIGLNVTNPTNALMSLESGNWVTVGGGLLCYMAYNGSRGVTALATDGSNVFAGGALLGGYNGDSLEGSTNCIKWNGSAWQTMGNGSMFPGAGFASGDPDICAIAVCDTNVFVTGGYSLYPP